MRNMKTVILGSGATCGTLAGCPTTAGFGSALRARLTARGEDWRSKYSCLARVVDELWPEQAVFGSAWDLAHVWTRVDYFSKLPSLRATGDYGAQASYDLHAAVLEVYGGQLCNELTELLRSGRGFTLLDIIAELQHGDVLVSFNWDVVVELVAMHADVNLVQTPHVASVPSVRLVKPHGSVSWRRRLHERRIEMGATPAPCTQPMQPNEVIPGCVQPFVIGALPVKSELIQEMQGNYPGSPYSVLVEQWKEFMDALVIADEVVIAGYALPDYDAYGRFLIQEAIARRGHHAIQRLYFYERESVQAAMASKLASIFKPAIPPIWRGPVA